MRNRNNRWMGTAGFTLVEVMVVVLVIAVLLAVAVPIFLGARRTANDRAAQTTVRNALTVEMVFFSDDAAFTDGLSALKSVDSSFDYTKLPALMTPGKVYVDVDQTKAPDDTVIIGAKSASGRCFWLRAISGAHAPRYATTECPDGTTIDVPTTFGDAWE